MEFLPCALPCRWIGPKLDAKDRSSFAVERIEIAHEGIEVDNDAEPFELKIGPKQMDSTGRNIRCSDLL